MAFAFTRRGCNTADALLFIFFLSSLSYNPIAKLTYNVFGGTLKTLLNFNLCLAEGY